MIENILIISMVFIGTPILTYFVVKFGTIGYYKGKELLKNEKSDE